MLSKFVLKVDKFIENKKISIDKKYFYGYNKKKRRKINGNLCLEKRQNGGYLWKEK